MRDEVREYIDIIIPVLYRDSLKNLTPMFPLNPKTVFLITLPSSCRVVSYQRLATQQGLSVASVAAAFGSPDGCTHYDRKNRRYLVSYNSDIYRPRIRWTLAHELGHILCGHFIEKEEYGGDVPDELWQHMEEEADYFAAELLSPIVAMRKYRVRNTGDIRKFFGLSETAASYRMAEYVRTLTDGPDDRFEGVRFTVSPRLLRKPYSDSFVSDTEMLYTEGF